MAAMAEVPLTHSLLADAPGYVGESEGELGPLCWKCCSPSRGRPAPGAAPDPGPGLLPTGPGGRGAAKVCPVCAGKGRLLPTRKRRKQLSAPAVPPLIGRPPDWTSPGPAPATPLDVTAATLGPDEQLVSLVGDWRIIQRRAGHRWTTDDLITAWAAVKAARAAVAETTAESSSPGPSSRAPPARPSPPRRLRCLDLGTGNGTVLLMVAHAFPEAECVGIEAREEAVALAVRSIAHNVGPPSPAPPPPPTPSAPSAALQSASAHAPAIPGHAAGAGSAAAAAGAGTRPRPRVRVVRADLRETAALDALLREMAVEGAAEGQTGAAAVGGCGSGDGCDGGDGGDEARWPGFDLITGTPPYWLVSTTTTPADGSTESQAGIVGAAAGAGAQAEIEAEAAGISVGAGAGERSPRPPPPPAAARLSTRAREGSMTTSIEDAPARCCFRGTVAAYCAAAARCLSRAPHARFTVCESAAHDGRVLAAAAEAGLEVVSRVSLHGREGKAALLRVWTMRRPRDEAGRLATADAARRARVRTHGGGKEGGGAAEACPPWPWVEEAIDVRGADEKWSARYCEVLEEMGIPTRRDCKPHDEPGAAGGR